jgi:MoaA/NifB/PqqE/SkfB family radical SAM enzyme
MADHAIFGQAKLLNHPEKIDAWMQGAPESLVTVELDLTNRCNNQCPGCAGGRASFRDELRYEEARKYMRQIAVAGAKAVIFTGGGEPLLHPDAVRLMRHAFEDDLEVGLITNGLALTPAMSEELVSLCTWIRVSLDAGTAAMYRRTHGVNQFARVVANIGQLVQAKYQTPSPCTIGVGYLTGRETLAGMEAFLQVATDLGVDYAQFRPFHGDFTPVQTSVADLQTRYPIATWSAQKYEHFADLNKRPYTACHGRHFVTVIGADAHVYVCCHMRGKREYSLGDLRQASFEQIWARRYDLTIDFADCPFFCRADECNRLLFELQKPKTHVNFL